MEETSFFSSQTEHIFCMVVSNIIARGLGGLLDGLKSLD
ncbi:hypothetical protein CHCC14820_0190 [Bacillus paralicheniformis]|uniref:Uncharacterized protein n=2 Tax=Bacillus subtilis group TaxID=653685 RepID=A0A8B5YIH6_BACLI|nr:hypothetical protein SC10_B2orf04903 [Bacillus paralicheniformis]AKQ74457.1 hypothetical protein MUY_003325 [Bacillus licheniformis WX-02]KYC76743.1 hypothetical protein B4090_3429 [Bacillus licheniformis]TWN15495.1 hypothetical protein CHCC14564_0060 [Bacillus licheniformis LMG 17339]KYC93252.1 hypothetical protein B4164_3134 [Bacillus licheniformis]